MNDEAICCDDCGTPLVKPDWAEPGLRWRCYPCGWGE